MGCTNCFYRTGSVGHARDNQHELSDPFVTPGRSLRQTYEQAPYGVFGAVHQDESNTEARLLALETRLAALERLVQLMDNSGASPLHRELTTASEEAVKKSVLAYVNSRIERVTAHISSRMDRRDSLVDAQLGQLAYHIGNIVQGLNNLAQYVANFVRGLSRPSSEGV
ncbi:hypothetical protein N7481_006744 [Penicillium waksmanii]|uniref:uncharacterized protein n=1 Tax=Penicillium waksmanii TaxID=69791 RepID=UPI002548809D|nr:uncharacterized protein N7481_006744 [Penicillium waksmanii]KAJ5984645.1 hypothetical protein N7481_006744 [Penicillium waksmanii]